VYRTKKKYLWTGEAPPRTTLYRRRKEQEKVNICLKIKPICFTCYGKTTYYFHPCVLQLDKLERGALSATNHDQLPANDVDFRECLDDTVQHHNNDPGDWVE